MRIIGSDRHKMIIKENSYDLLAKSALFFIVGLIITINAANNRETTMFLTILVGQILMASSFLFFALFYKVSINLQYSCHIALTYIAEYFF